MGVAAPDDLDDPMPCPCRGLPRLGALIAGIGKDAFDEGKQCARALIEHQACAVAILDVGGMNGDAQQEAEGVDQDVPLAPRDFLARVVT